MGRVDAVLDYCGPVAYGLAAHLAACRLTFVMRWIKTDDTNREADPIG